MNRQEFLLNKPILREINAKKKDGSIFPENDNAYDHDHNHM
jgi:hypothetical protein